MSKKKQFFLQKVPLLGLPVSLLPALPSRFQVAAPEEPECLGQSNPGYVGDPDSPDGGGLSSLEDRDRQRELEYNAASPDEKALVEACGSFGVQVTDRARIQETYFIILGSFLVFSSREVILRKKLLSFGHSV